MKKAFLSLAMVALLLCSACGGSAEAAVSVAGTWYSVVNEGMYNFSDGNITLSGVTVGQYEDNGDSVVISMIDDGSNLQLYVTKMGDIDVLADVREGNGNVYFCKGLENVQAIIQDNVNKNPIAGKYYLSRASQSAEAYQSIITLYFGEDQTIHVVDSGWGLPGDKRTSYYGTYFYNGSTLIIKIDGVEYAGVVNPGGESLQIGSTEFVITDLDGLSDKTRAAFENNEP